MPPAVLDMPAPAVTHAPPERPTLEDLILGVWEDLGEAPHAASCPVCGEGLAPRFGAGSRPVGAACGGCGSQLA
jgi:hypothetical protein